MIGELMNVLGILIVALLAQQPRPSSIEGIAVKAGTSEPIAKAVVELTRPLAGSGIHSTQRSFRQVRPYR